MPRSFSFTLDKFYGIDYRAENTDSVLYSPDAVNFCVTDSYKLKKRDGYAVIFPHSSAGRGIISCRINSCESVFYCVGKNVYCMKSGEEREIGTLDSDEGDVTFLLFSNRLYIFDGVKIKVYDGENFGELEPYRPLIAVSTTPDGAGVAYEEKNLLTGKMRQSFTMNGTGVTLKLALEKIDSVDYVKIGDETVEKNLYTVNLEKGSVTLESKWRDYEVIDGIEIGFSKSDGQEGDIHRMRYGVLYGGENDTHVFLYGDRSDPSLIRYSGVSGGCAMMEYFPENSFNRVGTKSGVVSIVRHYDRLVIFCEGEAFYAYTEESTGIDGKKRKIFPQRPLSNAVGCCVPGFAPLVDSYPVTFDRGTLFRWRETSVRDERYAEDIGGRIKAGLAKWNPEKIRCFDNFSSHELYVYYGNEIFLYNYRLDTFCLWRGIASCGFALTEEGKLFFLREDGSLCLFSASEYDDTKPVEAYWTSGYMNIADGVKNLYRVKLVIRPDVRTRADLFWYSDHAGEGKKSFSDSYRRFAFSSLDFSSLGFMTSLSPVKMSYRLRHKRFERIKLKISCDSPGASLHLLSLCLEGAVTQKK